MHGEQISHICAAGQLVLAVKYQMRSARRLPKGQLKNLEQIAQMQQKACVCLVMGYEAPRPVRCQDASDRAL